MSVAIFTFQTHPQTQPTSWFLWEVRLTYIYDSYKVWKVFLFLLLKYTIHSISSTSLHIIHIIVENNLDIITPFILKNLFPHANVYLNKFANNNSIFKHKHCYRRKYIKKSYCICGSGKKMEIKYFQNHLLFVYGTIKGGIYISLFQRNVWMFLFGFSHLQKGYVHIIRCSFWIEVKR